MITIECRARHADGSWRLLESTGQNLLDDSAVGGVLITSRDITEQRRVDAALRDSEEWFRLLAEKSQDVIFRRNTAPKEPFDYVSPSVEPMTGYTPEEAYADPAFWVTHTHRDDLELIVLPEPDGPPVRNVTRWLSKDGSWVWIETTASATVDDEGRIMIRGAGRDVSEQQVADEALQTSEQPFRNIAAQLFDIVMIASTPKASSGT